MAASTCLSNAMVVMGGALLCGCAAQSAPGETAKPPGREQEQTSILAGSTPAAGSTITGPVDELKLHFNPPARLHDVTVTGPSGMTPMMVTAVGEASDYSLPLHSLGPGNYIVTWKAFSGAKQHQGSFPFTVR